MRAAFIPSLRRPILAALLAALSSAALAQQEGPLADTSRLIAIGGSLTEIVYALGEESRLVARDSTGLFPEAALALPDIGYMRQLSPEGVLSVNPTALLVLEGSGPPEAIEVLTESGVEYRAVADTHTHEGILAKVRAVGTALGVEDKAEALATEIDGALDALEARKAGIAAPKKVLFVLSVQDGRLLVSGTGSAADAAITLAGGANAITEFAGYRPLADEAIIAAAPDAVLVMDRGGGHALTVDELAGHPGLAMTPAGQNREIITMDGAYLLGFGPRTADALTELADRLYGPAR